MRKKGYHGRAGTCLLFGAVLLTGSPWATAADAALGGGQILRQIEPRQAPAPSGNKTGLIMPKKKHRPVPEGVSFKVNRIRITGNTLFRTATLHALVAGSEHRSLNLKQLNALAGRITDYYHRHGYSLTRAVIPAQEIENGVVEIRVLEARYGKVNLNDYSRVRKGLLESTLSPLQSGRRIRDRSLNRSMLLLSDIPGIAVNATLKAGKTVGTSNIDVNVHNLPMLTGQLSTNNFGNKYTGRVRGGLALQLNNPLHLGDQLSFNGITTGRGVNFGQLGYQTVLNGYGTRMGAGYAVLDYILGGALGNLGGHGTARVGRSWLSQSLYRSRGLNVYTRLQYNNKRLRDHIDVSQIRTDRHLQDGAISLSGNMRDSFISGAVSAWNVRWTSGRVKFDNFTAGLVDAVTARTAGNFTKWNGRFSRLQGLGRRNSLLLAVSGQWSTHNLDSVEKLVVGGPRGVRAYDIGILSADSGYLARVELRHQFTPNWQVFALFDNQRVRINNRPWYAGVNEATLSGAGGGIRFNAASRWHAEVAVARSVGPRSVLITDSPKPRVWVQFSKGF